MSRTGGFRGSLTKRKGKEPPSACHDFFNLLVEGEFFVLPSISRAVSESHNCGLHTRDLLNRWVVLPWYMGLRDNPMGEGFAKSCRSHNSRPNLMSFRHCSLLARLNSPTHQTFQGLQSPALFLDLTNPSVQPLETGPESQWLSLV